jgi:hypothetical protein
MTAHRYSDASQAGHDTAQAILERTAHVEGLEADAASRERWVPAPFVIRVRRLIRSALLLADAGQGIEASIMLRSVTVA